VPRWFASFAVVFLAIPVALLSRHGVSRPAISGVAHIALKTNDLAAERAFYGKGCGFAELSSGRFKVNDRQYIEILPTLESETADRLDHIAFETSNLRAMRDYLASQNVAVPASVSKDADGNLSMILSDPENHRVELVQYVKGSVQTRAFGKLLAETRVSERLIHVGVTVRDRAATDRFYKDILGFKMTWYGGPTDDTVKWVDMRVPEGTDWLEYMLVSASLTPKQLGVLHHLALGVPDIQAGFKTVSSRGITAPEPPKIGRDGKWQLNLYDANLTRIELMEPKPVQAPCCSPYAHP
jgi:catechol 2,3-dioxygenase-like lactoylglutathione lyase family enzyme